jgi:hypothetical protein
MIILDATTKSLEAVLGGATAANQLPFTAGYQDLVASPAYLESDGQTSGATAVTLVAAPAANVQRIVKHLSLVNADTAQATVTIRLNNNGTVRNIFVATLASGDNLVYTADGQFQVLDANGNLKVSALSLPLAVASGGTGVTSLTPGSYSPTLTNITIGNGSVTGSFVQIGNIVFWQVLITFGTTTSLGAVPRVSVPVPASVNVYGPVMSTHSYAVDSSSGTSYFIGVVGTSTTDMLLVTFSSTSALSGNQPITSTVPFTWATGDTIQLGGVYFAA